MIKVKLCGMSRECDIEYANIAKPDYIGFVFADSKRKVSLEKAKELKKLLDKNISSVGVFVNEDIDFIRELIDHNVIDIVQLHGDEDKEYIMSINRNIPVIKAANLENVLEAAKLPVDYILLDAAEKNARGGTGKRFDWSKIPEIDKPYFIAGGIDLDNVLEAKELNPFGIDVSSGIETEHLKDKEKMIEMVRRIRL